MGMDYNCAVATPRARNRRIHDNDDDDDDDDECDDDIRRVASEICARSFDVQIRGHGRGVCFNKQNDDDDEASWCIGNGDACDVLQDGPEGSQELRRG